MAQFLKVGSRTEFEDLEGGKLVEAGGQSIAILIWAGAITPSRIRVLVEADPWQKA
jgi:hypothetical protein